jgi:hypothetical protein
MIYNRIKKDCTAAIRSAVTISILKAHTSSLSAGIYIAHCMHLFYLQSYIAIESDKSDKSRPAVWSMHQSFNHQTLPSKLNPSKPEENDPKCRR